VVALEEWKTWEVGQPSHAVFREVEAPFNRDGYYRAIGARTGKLKDDILDVASRDGTLSASFQWGTIWGNQVGKIHNTSNRPISYFFYDANHRTYLVRKKLEAGKVEAFLHPQSFGTKQVLYGIKPHSA
jgi:hypothetical protein